MKRSRDETETHASGDLPHLHQYFLAGIGYLYSPDQRQAPPRVIDYVELRFGPHLDKGGLANWSFKATFANDDKHWVYPKNVLLNIYGGTFTALLGEHILVFQPNPNQLDKWYALHKHTTDERLKKRVNGACSWLRLQQ